MKNILFKSNIESGLHLKTNYIDSYLVVNKKLHHGYGWFLLTIILLFSFMLLSHLGIAS